MWTSDEVAGVFYRIKPEFGTCHIIWWFIRCHLLLLMNAVPVNQDSSWLRSFQRKLMGDSVHTVMLLFLIIKCQVWMVWRSQRNSRCQSSSENHLCMRYKALEPSYTCNGLMSKIQSESSDLLNMQFQLGRKIQKRLM